MNLPAIARALGGEVSGRRVRFAPPGHSKRDRSAWLEPATALPDGFYVGSFANDDVLIIKDYVRDRLNLARSHPAQPVRPFQVPSDSNIPTKERDAQGTGSALAIWNEALDARDTPAEWYLTRPKSENGRGVVLPDEAATETIRFHPSCPFLGERVPAMVCLIRDVISNEPKAIHRMALSRDGRKAKVRGADRLFLGPVRGGAIKITPDEEVTTCLGVAEGVETALSMSRLAEFGSSPVWSLMSAKGLERFPVLSGIECLWIAVDHDQLA